MNLKSIRDLTDRQEALDREVREWYLNELHPKIVSCSSLGDLDSLWSEVHRACAGNDGTRRDLPGYLSVEKIMSYDALRNKN